MTRCLFLFFSLAAGSIPAADWPQFRGPNRDSIWEETDILEGFPDSGLPIRWRVTVGPGHSSPVVAGGRVYVTDLNYDDERTRERIQCFDESTGEEIWTYNDDVDYGQNFDPKTPSGPCPTPTVTGKQIISLGATGHLLCLDTTVGDLRWRQQLAEKYSLPDSPNLTCCPVVSENLAIVAIGGKPGACVVAFDLESGDEVWRALDDPPRVFSSPFHTTHAGVKQLIIWSKTGVTSLNPKTGESWWRIDLETREDYCVATPVVDGDSLLISGLMLRLAPDRPGATILWPEKLTLSNRVLSHTCMPFLSANEVYAGKISGHLVCLDRASGSVLWETDKVTGLGGGAAIHLVKNGDSFLIFTDQGNLIRARLSRDGYQEISRTHLIDPTFQFGPRKLVWAPPAFSNSCVFARNDKELICASLAANP